VLVERVSVVGVALGEEVGALRVQFWPVELVKGGGRAVEPTLVRLLQLPSKRKKGYEQTRQAMLPARGVQLRQLTGHCTQAVASGAAGLRP
jgi:hypothetical protein